MQYGYTGLAVSVLVGLVTAPPVLAGLWVAFFSYTRFARDAALTFTAWGLLGFLGMILVHELGHVAAGRAVGFGFLRLVLGPVAVEKVGGRLTVRIRVWHRHGFATFVGLPPFCVARGRYAAYVAAGPVANVAAGVACLLAAGWVSPGPPPGAHPDARAGLWGGWVVHPGDARTAGLTVAGLSGLFLGFTSLAPARRADGLRTDGGQLLDLARGHAPWLKALEDSIKAAARSRVETAPAPAGPAADPTVPWEEPARAAWTRAEKEAAEAGSGYLGTVHLLKVILTGPPADLGSVPWDPAAVTAAFAVVPRPAARGNGPPAPTPRLRKAVERAVRGATAEHRPVGVPDLWRGLLADADAESGAVLARLGVRVEDGTAGFSDSKDDTTEVPPARSDDNRCPLLIGSSTRRASPPKA